MATRFNDFNSNGEERLLCGRECLSDRPIALSFPSPLRRPLALRQFEELRRAQSILAQEDGIFETDEEFFDFDMPTYEDYSDHLSHFEALSATLEEFANRKAMEGVKTPDNGVSETVVEPITEKPSETASSPLQGQENL